MASAGRACRAVPLGGQHNVVLYGAIGSVPVQRATNGTTFVRLALTPHQFVVLR